MAHFRQFQLLKYHREVSWNFELLALTAILSGGRFSYYASDVRDCVSFAIKCNAVSFQNKTFKSARRWTTSKWLWEDCSWVIDASKFCNQMQCCILKSKTYKSAQDTEQLLRLHPAAGWSMPPQVTDVGLAAILEHGAAYIWCTKSMH